MRTNGHHWHQYKILPDASQTSNISFRFECKAVKDCKVLFGYRTSHSHQFQIIFGSNYNANTQVFDGLKGAWEVVVNTPSIVSGSEFRHFWIDIIGPSIRYTIPQREDENSNVVLSIKMKTLRRNKTMSLSFHCRNVFLYMMMQI